MADDHYSRPPRPSDPFARAPAGQRGHASGGDPLAELARLIGQSDPYAGQAHPQSHPAYNGAHDPRYAQGEPAEWGQPSDPYQPQHDPYAQPQGYQDGYGAHAPYNPPAYQDPHYPAPQPQDYRDPQFGDPAYGDPYYADQNYANGAPHQDPHYAPQSDAHYAPQPYESQHTAQPYASQPYADPQYSERAHDPRFGDQHQAAPQFASPQYDDKPYPAYDNQLYAKQAPAFPPAVPHGDPYAAHAQAAPNGPGYPGGYYDPNSPAYGAPYYQHETSRESEEAPARRRGGLVTVLAVLALAVVGTAAAFGYRAVFVPGATRVQPPVIKADTAPSKIVPAASDAKPIQDRVGDRAQIERIINREEQPVDVNAARAGAPRVVFPGPNPIAPLPNSPIPQSPAAAAPVQAATAPTGTTAAPASTEPKKIRTVTIRSDQPELAAAANAAATSAPRTASAASGVLPDDQSQARAQVPAATSSGPLSLSPGSAPAPQQQRSAPVRTAAVPPAASGGYSVQVTSQRSESEAQAAYAQLQAKFPSVLGSRQAVIRRADLGDKGTYYRAQIPFGSQAEAADFCTGLRNAGGQCVVQRN